MIKKLINYLLQGLLYIAPLGITGYVIYSIFNFVDDLLQNLLTEFFGIRIPGLGVLTLVLILILTGFIGRTFIADPLKVVFRKVIERIPILNFIYSALNDLFSAFVGKEKKFNKPVLNGPIKFKDFIKKNDEFQNNSKAVLAYTLNKDKTISVIPPIGGG